MQVDTNKTTALTSADNKVKPQEKKASNVDFSDVLKEQQDALETSGGGRKRVASTTEQATDILKDPQDILKTSGGGRKRFT